MYPLHCNYVATVPCKAISMKIIIFVIVLVLKSNKNIEISHFRLSQLANNFHSNCFTQYCGCIIKVQSIRCIPSIQRSVRIKQLREFLKSDHRLRIYCIFSGGYFILSHPVDSAAAAATDDSKPQQNATEFWTSRNQCTLKTAQ